MILVMHSLTQNIFFIFHYIFAYCIHVCMDVYMCEYTRWRSKDNLLESALYF